jgi:hypothetical protein
VPPGFADLFNYLKDRLQWTLRDEQRAEKQFSDHLIDQCPSFAPGPARKSLAAKLQALCTLSETSILNGKHHASPVMKLTESNAKSTAARPSCPDV